MTGLSDTPSSASTSETMVSGIRHSRMTSPMMNSGVRIAGFLNSRSLPTSVRIVFICLLFVPYGHPSDEARART